MKIEMSSKTEEVKFIAKRMIMTATDWAEVEHQTQQWKYDEKSLKFEEKGRSKICSLGRFWKHN